MRGKLVGLVVGLVLFAATSAWAEGFSAGERQFLYRELLRARSDVAGLVLAVSRERAAGGSWSDVVAHDTSGANAWRLSLAWRSTFAAHAAALAPLAKRLDVVTGGFPLDGSTVAYAGLVKRLEALGGRIELDLGQPSARQVTYALRKLEEKHGAPLSAQLAAAAAAVGASVPEAGEIDRAEVAPGAPAAGAAKTRSLTLWLGRAARDLAALTAALEREASPAGDALENQVLVHDRSGANEWYLQERYRLGFEALAAALEPLLEDLDQGPTALRGSDPAFRFVDLAARLRALCAGLAVDLGDPGHAGLQRALRRLGDDLLPPARASLAAVVERVKSFSADPRQVADAVRPAVGFEGLEVALPAAE